MGIWDAPPTEQEIAGARPSREQLIEAAAAKHGVPANLIRATIKVESGGDAAATSPVGARGLMQLMPGTARDLGVTDPEDESQNIDAGTRYLAQQHQRFGSWEKALAAYNAGPEAVSKAGGIPGFEETQRYVPAVMAHFRRLEGAGNPGVWDAPPTDEEVAALAPPPYSPAASPDTAAARAQFEKAAGAGAAPAAILQDTTDAAIAGAPEIDAGPVPAPTPEQQRIGELLHFDARSSAMTPEKLADVKRIAIATGFSADYVAQHYDGPMGFGREYQGKPFTFWADLAAKSPAFARYLLENPLDHALFNDGGLAEMTGLEWWLTGRLDLPATTSGRLGTGGWQPPAIIQRIQALLPAEKLAWKKAQRAGAAPELTEADRRADQIASGAVGLPLPPEEAERLALSSAAPPPPQAGAADEAFLAGLDQQIAELEQRVPQRIDYGPQGRSILGRVVLSTIDMLPYLGESAVVGSVAGVPGLLSLNLARGAGEAHQAALAEGMKGREAQEFGALGGVLEAPLYTFGLSQFVPKLSLFGKSTAEEVVARTAASVLARKSIARAIGEAAVRGGEHAGMGATSMGFAAGVGRLHLELGRAEIDPTHPIDFEAAVTDAVETAVRTTVDLAGLSAIGVGGAMLRYAGARRATSAGLAQLTAFGDAARAAEHLGVPQDVASRIVQGVRDAYSLQPGEAPESALVAIDGWQRYWQAEKVDPRQVAQELGVGAAYDQAVAVGSDGFLDIPLPLARKLAVAEEGKHWAALLPDMKFSRRPEVATPRQQQEMDKSDLARVQELAKLEPDAMEASQRRVFDAARDLALEGGKPLRQAVADAKLEAARYRRLAEWYGHGEDAWTLYDSIERHIHGPQSAMDLQRQALAAAAAEYDVHPAARALTLVGSPEAPAKKAPAAKQEPAGEAQVETPPPARPAAESAPAPKAAPAAATSEGSATRIITPQVKEGEPAEYRWVPREKVQASHLPRQGFGKNPAYPEGVQERAYHADPVEQRKVIENARGFKASLVLSNNETPGDGPPIVTEAGANGSHLVLGGNSRRMTIGEALDASPEREAEYLDTARKQAALYGIDPATMTAGGMLVRVVKGFTPESPKPDLVRAVTRYNGTLTQALENRAKAVSEAKNMTPEVARELGQLLARHPDATLRDIMRESPAALVEPLRRSGLIHDTNENEWVRGGELTPEAKDRIQAMLVGRVIGDVDRWNATPASMEGKIERIAPELIQAASSFPEADEIPTVQKALDVLNEMRAKGGLSIDELLRTYTQADIFSRETRKAPDRAVLAMARLLAEEKPKALQARFQKWAQAIEGDLFAPPIRVPEDARRVLLGDSLQQARLALGADPWKMDRAAVEEMVGPELAKRLAYATGPDGIHPDDLAREVGHESGAGLLHDMLARQDRQAWIEERARERQARNEGAQALDPRLVEEMQKVRRELAAIREAHPDDYNLFAEWRDAHERFMALRQAAEAGGGVPDWYFQGGRRLSPEQRAKADELRAIGAHIDGEGRVLLYHRTSKDAAQAIRETGRLITKEDGAFFSTRRSGQNTGYGPKAIAFRVPLDKIEIDDVFADEAHVRIPMAKAGDLDVSKYRVTGPDAFRGMSREEFLGHPTIMKMSDAAALVPRDIVGKDAEAVPFLGGRYTAKFAVNGSVVYDGETPIASYNHGETLAVAKKYRRQGVAEELVYQWRTRFPDEALATSRNKVSQHIQEKVWDRIQRELAGASTRLYQGGLPEGVIHEAPLEPGPRWHSALERAAVSAKQAKGTPDSWLAVLSKTPGVKAEEIEETGLREWLKAQKGTLSREQVSEFIRAHRVEVTERVLGGPDEAALASARRGLADAGVEVTGKNADWGEAPTYRVTMPWGVFEGTSGRLYSEIHDRAMAEKRDRLPEEKRALALTGEYERQLLAFEPTQYEQYTLGGHREGSARELLFYTRKARGFTDPHFGEAGQGLLAHARITEHVGADGKPVLVVEEIQSGLHQKGREKGYTQPADQAARDAAEAEAQRTNEAELAYRRELVSKYGREMWGKASNEERAKMSALTQAAADASVRLTKLTKPGVPDAPWKESWEALVARRLVRWAAEHGYDRIAWTTGEQQAERYDLRKRVGSIRASFDKGRPDEKGDPVLSDTGTVTAFSVDGQTPVMRREFANQADLAGMIGKEAADKVFAKREENRRTTKHGIAKLEGLDLALGGEGMRVAYDKRIPGVFEKIIKKWGGKVGKEKIDPAAEPGPETTRYAAVEDEDGRWSVIDTQRGGDVVRDFRFDGDAARAEETRLNAAGVAPDDAKYERPPTREVWTATLPLQLRAEVLANGMPLFQVSKQGPRGYVEFSAGKGSKARADIHLLFGSDASTNAHESMHIFSKILGDVASREDAPADLKAAYQSLLDAMGYASHDERVKAPVAAKEEKVTHLWEMYLAEGKAPSYKLRGTFELFKRWMLRIYGDLFGEQNGAAGVAAQYEAQYGEKLVLSDEVRKVFDRLLASESEAEKIAAEFDPPVSAKLPLTEQERQEDARLASESKQLTADAIVKLAAADDATDVRQAADAEGKRIRAAVQKQIADSDPGYRALALLQTGEIPGAEALADFLKGKDGRPAKLDRAATAALIGAEATRALPKGIFARGKNGVTPDDLAQRLAMTDGRELLAAIQGKDFPGAVKDAIDKHLDERFGPALLQNPEQLRAAALDGFHNEAALKRIFLRLSAMAREIGPKAQRKLAGMRPSDMRALADRVLLTKPIRSISADAYANKESGAARRAVQLYEAGKKDAAWDEAEAQAWNHVFARAARDLREEVDAAQKTAREARSEAWRADLGKAWVEEAQADGTTRQVYPHRDVTDAILYALGLGGEAKPIAEQLETLRLLENLTQRSGNELEFDVEGVRALLANPTRWSDLPAETALGIRDALKNLRRLARDVNEMELDNRRVERAAVIAELRATGEKNLPEQPKLPRDELLGHGLLRTLRRLGQETDGALLDITSMAHLWDGGDRDGIFHRIFIDGEHACRAKRDELFRTVLKEMVAKFEKSGISRARLYEKLDVALNLPPDLARTWDNGPITRSNLLMMLLNLGNQSNEERFLGGLKWSRQQVLREVGRYLTKEEVLWAQDVWNTIEKLYPEMAKVHADETGIPPEKIKAKALDVQLVDGTVVHLDGGYFPARYDARPGTNRRMGEQQIAEEVSSFIQQNYTLPPATRSTHAKKRAAHFQDVVNLSWSVVPTHLAQVIHDTTYRKWVRQTAALLLNSDVRNMLVQRLGEDRASQLRPWLRAVANRTADAAPENLRNVDRAWSWARSKAAVSALGWSISRAMGDLSDPTIAVAAGYVRPDFLARATLECAGSPREMQRFVFDNSLEARQRTDHVGHRFTAEIGQMGGRSGMQNPLLRTLHETAFVTEEMVDRLVIPPTWLARYRQSMAEYRAQGMTEEEAHTKAVRDGDDVIRAILPPMDIADKPALIRDRRGLGGLLLFYGHANKIGNIFRRRAADLARTWRSDDATGTAKAGELAKLLGTTIAITAANGLLAEWLTGRGKEDGEDEADWVLRKSVSQLLYPVPFGSVAEFGIRKAMGDNKQVSIRNAPQLGLAQDLWNNLGTWGEALMDGDAGAEPKIAAALEIALAVAAGAPTRQAHKTIGYLSDLAQGNTSARGPLDVAGGVTFGESNTAPGNPFTDAQDTIGGGR